MKIGVFLFAFCSYGTFFSQQSHNQISFYFDFGKWTLSSSEEEKIAQFLTENNSIVTFLKLEAHTDTVGSTEFNKNLALKRYNTVKNILNQELTNVPIIIGEAEAQKSTNYVASEYRKVIVYYEPSKFPERIEKRGPTSKMVTEIDSFLNDTIAKSYNFDLSILFEGGTDFILKESESELFELLTILKNNSYIRIIIHGHVCCGSDQVLSENRARAVFNFLVSNQIERNRLKYMGHNNTQPKYPLEKNDFERQQNRRVTIEFLK